MNTHYQLKQKFRNMVITLIIHVPAYKLPNNQSDDHVLTFDKFENFPIFFRFLLSKRKTGPHSSSDQLHSAQKTFPLSTSLQKLFKKNPHPPHLLPSENITQISQLLSDLPPLHRFSEKIIIGHTYSNLKTSLR